MQTQDVKASYTSVNIGSMEITNVLDTEVFTYGSCTVMDKGMATLKRIVSQYFIDQVIQSVHQGLRNSDIRRQLLLFTSCGYFGKPLPSCEDWRF
jgi:hypothetical protein